MSSTTASAITHPGRNNPVFEPGDLLLPEVLLYVGNSCNRDCYFCCVDGRPSGWFKAFDLTAPVNVMKIIRPDARIKLYGGEPTSYHKHLIEVMQTLRGLGFTGLFRIFSNGILADRLIQMLESDPATTAVKGSDSFLNYSIWHGLGVKPIPPKARAKLEEYSRTHPDRVWLSHEDLIPVGGAETKPITGRPAGKIPDFGGKCARCFPTLRSDGLIHACAFAAEVVSPQFDLGRIGDSPEAVGANYREFLRWIGEELEPAAAAAGEAPCVTCLRSARERAAAFSAALTA